MAILNSLRHRRDQHLSAGTANLSGEDFKDDSKVASNFPSDSDSDTLSLEAKNEKEVQQNPDRITANANAGVQKAEAVALVWSKPVIFASYAWIWLCYFFLALQQSCLYNVSYYAYNTFSNAPALTTANILSVIVGGVLKLPIAKLINVWGRSEAYLVFVGVYLLGMILIASTSGPDQYAAGYTIYWIGYDALYLILDIYVADSFGLRNRALAFAFASTPFICTAFTGPLVAQTFIGDPVTGAGWQWAIGTFCIVNTVVFVPLAVVFKLYERKAKKLGIYKSHNSGRTTMQSIMHYIHEFDVVGAIILCAAFVLFLLPWSLQSYGRAAYTSATFIAMVVIGAFTFILFYIWERYFARVHFIRYELLRERTVLGACILAATINFSFYCWDLQYLNYVKVVYALPVSLSGYMGQIYNVGSTFWSVVFGVYVRYTKRFKWFAFCFGLPMMLLGAGLMIHFRGSDSPIGYIIMCQIFIAFGGGTLVISEEMAVMAAADREGVPLMLSMIYLFGSVGSSFGQAVSTAIYSNVWPAACSDALPADLQDKVQELYFGGYSVQEMFVPGTVIRDAVNYAWEREQFYSCIAATCVLVVGGPAILLWKNYWVGKKQNKGTVL